MTLLSTIQLAKNSLFTSQLGIQVASQNIANADTPGYVREKLLLTTGPTAANWPADAWQRGHVCWCCPCRSTNSSSNDCGPPRVTWETARFNSKHIAQLEAAIGEFSDVDLSSSLAQFFNSINDVLNQPEDPSVRNLGRYPRPGAVRIRFDT